MGYRGDERGGDDRWREREREQGRGREPGGWSGEREHRREQGRSGYGGGGDDWNEGRREAAGWGPGIGSGHQGDHDHRGGHGGGDRGFFERATEGVRSFFGGSDEHDGGGRWSQERGRGEYRDNGYGSGGDSPRGGGAGSLGGGGFGGGWGNQAGESWNRDRPGEQGWFTESVGGERGVRPGAGGGHSGAPDRAMPGGQGGYTPMTGNYGHGSSGFGGGYDPRGERGREHREGGGRGGAGHVHDPHYAQWRQRQVEDLDRDYEEYRQEHQSKFEQEFGNWRSKRQGQRQLIGRVTEQMEVLGSDGTHVGTVDKVRGDRIILTKNDPNADGIHHSIPCSWVENVDGRVTLNRTAEQALSEWRDEERNRALFERRDSGSEGPHVLNRSFSGTYKDGDQ